MRVELSELPESKREAISEFIKILRESFGESIAKVILFGSVARGDFTDESDIDVLVVGDVRLEDISKITSHILLKYGEVISAMVRTEEEVMSRKSFSFYRNILREGVEIA
ncbi:nucleotidyltransferase domain-containing protein [Geoglobus sp.]